MENNSTEITDVEKEPLLPLSEARALFDIPYLINALIQTGGHISRAAEELGTTRQTVYDLMEKYGISCAEGKLSIELTPLLRHVELRVPRFENYLIQDQ
jgi:DNA-binding NtrC family response regulator